MKRHLLLFPLLLLTTAVVAQPVPADGLFSWQVPVSHDVRIGCWDHDGFSITDQPGSGEMIVVARMKGGRLTTLRASDRTCSVEGAAQRLALDVNASIDFLASHLDGGDGERAIAVLAMHESPRVEPLLEKFASSGARSDIREQAVFWLGQRGGEAGFRYLRDLVRGDGNRELQKKAVFSMSQSSAAGATQELIDLARGHRSSDIRREAIFWLGQKAGSKAAGELRRAVDEDPDDDVREHAVFAISQLPRDRAVPLLIDLARHHKSARVREKALFWLAQTNDPRALDLIEEILAK
jgi:HEAT repeat protein